MKPMLDAFWRAVMYCLHPRVVGLSLLPLVLMVALSLGLGYFFWDSTVALVSAWLDTVGWLGSAVGWVASLGLGQGALPAWIAPLLVLAVAAPLVVVLCLLLVALLMTPAIVALVGQRRFAELQKRRGGSLLSSALWSLGSLLAALLALVLSMPLWLIPPLVLILPPLIWGWLTYRVFAYDALAEHASAEERTTLLRQHRASWLVMGVISGYLGAAPTLLWASGALVIPLAPLLIPLAIWIYTLVFAFASLWFTHFGLAALQRLRAAHEVEVLDRIDHPAAPAPVESAGALPTPASAPAPLPLPPAAS